MSEPLTLFSLLGAANLADAAQKWPHTAFLPGPGITNPPENFEPLLEYLNTVLSFAAVRPGSATDRVGLAAEVAIAPHPNPQPLVLRALPDFAFVLQPLIPARPARLFVTRSDTGVEVVLEGLPVEIRLPVGLLAPLRSVAEEAAGPSLADVHQAGPFEPGVPDTFAVVLRDLAPSSLFVHLRVRLTEEGQVVVEPAVPISIGPCRFSELPCAGVHDLGFLPHPTLTGQHTQQEVATEWARHDIPGEQGGAITVRTLDLDHSRDPLKRLVDRFADPNAASELEFVLEDLALPVSAWVFPKPSHGRFGLRRAVLTGGDEAEAYDLTLAPVEVNLSESLGLRLKIFRLLFETPDTVIARMAVLFGDSVEEDHALVIDVSDGWLLQGAWLPPDPIQWFTLAGAKVSLLTTKLGFLLRGLVDTQDDASWQDNVQVLVDLGIAVGADERESFQLNVPGRPPAADLGQDFVLRDLGWNLGAPWQNLPSLWIPETLKLHAFKVIQLDLEEVVFLNEDNGGRYIGFSGGVSIFPGMGQSDRKTLSPLTPGVPVRDQPPSGGLRVRRLRLRIAGNELAPRWLLDGVGLFIKVGGVELSGSGSITDVTRDGHRFQEFGLSVLLRYRPGKPLTEFGIGGQLCYGRVSGPVDNHTYWLIGVQLSYFPLGMAELRGIRLLLAGGMAPDLPEPSGRPQEMRLLDWYKQHSDTGAVEVRSDRSQRRGGWKVEQGALAVGVGADLGLAVGKAVILRAFALFHRGDSGSGALVAVEVFALKATTPLGTGALEVDIRRDRWSALIGVDIELAKLAGTDSALVKGLARLTGTMFAGNQPGMFAIGQLADQASWLTLSVNKKLLNAQGRVVIAFCFQMSVGGPRGAGLAVTVEAQGSFGIGRVRFYATFGLLVGVWGNEASSSGFMAWAEIALRIKVFWVFSFGASVKAIVEQLGPQEPNYRRVSLEIRIETPWWLPDVTFRCIKVRETPRPEAMPVLSEPVLTAGAIEPAAATETPLATTGPGAGGAVRPIAELRALPSGSIPDSVWNTLTPVAVDSTIAVNLAVAVGNETTVVPSTPPDAGRQAATAPAQNDLTATYTLVRVGIRRRPRFGPDAGVWTDLLAPADSEIGGLEELLNDPDLSVRFASDVRFRWDADVINDDVIEPRRLLMNAEHPYTFLTANPAGEEGVLAKDPAFPCCPGPRTVVEHVLDFLGMPFGERVPETQRFSGSTSTLRWLLPRPPVVVDGVGTPPEIPVARVLIVSSTDLAIGVVTFDEPAFRFDLRVFWRPVGVPDLRSALVVEAARGLEIVARQVVPLSQGSPSGPIRIEDPRGLTSVTLRYLRQTDGAGPTSPSEEWLEIRDLRYRTVREERDRLADQGRCQAQGGVAGGGKLAWLPNHDYELALAVRTTVDHQRSEQEAVVVRLAGFRTRGLPGRNAVESPGTELEPYVESIYPGATGPLYRAEPVVLAFDERFSTLLPVDRTPAPDAPAERTQLLEWVLAVEQTDGRRLSVPSADWVVAHRGTPAPPGPRVIDNVLVQAAVRRAGTQNPLVQRLETLELLSPACDDGVRLHSSQILRHAPVDPSDAAVALWPARTTLRVAVRDKAGPHVSRRPFESGDVNALTVADEGRTTSTGWQVTDGVLRVAGATTPGLRHYAVLGEANWDHVTIHAEVDPAGGAAGVAVAVAGLPLVARALLALVDAGQVRLLARRGGVTQVLASAPLPVEATAPYALRVQVFDDRVRARVGEVTVEAARGDLRDGRVAVVLDGPGGCSALRVDGLDAYVTQLTTSRYPDFPAHIASFDGVVRSLPGAAGAVPALRTATSALLAEVMAGGDPQARQRLFDRWISELAIPLAPTVDGVRLSSVGNQLLVLESPEPLPFSRDIGLTVSHTVFSQPEPPAGVSPALMQFAAGLFLTIDTVQGEVPAQAETLVRKAKRLIHAAPAGDGQVEFRGYLVSTVTTPDGPFFEGQLDGVISKPPMPIPVDHVGLLDTASKPLAPALPLAVEHDENVALAVLTNSVEDRALLIPSAAISPDSYTFTWTIDRPRFRSATADGTTNYRDTAVSTINIG